jgi:hypothetical protein
VIVKRGGRYGVSVYDKTLGRKRWVGTYATQREARDAEREAASASAVLGRETCADYAVRWLKEQPRKAAASRRTYGYALQGFRRDFAALPLRDLDKPTARRWALKQPASTARVARAMFTDAINDGLHAGPNPFSNLRLPSPPVLAGHSFRPRRSACRESRRLVWMEHWRRMSSALSSEP